MNEKEKKFYQMRLPDTLENENVLNFIKYAKTSFDSSKINYPRGLKSQADRVVWLMNYALENLARENNNKIENVDSFDVAFVKKDTRQEKNQLLNMLK